MRIGDVTIENFQAIGEINMNLDNRGLVLVQGENKDDTSQESNGSGKSSISDAIHWCFFGSTPRGVTGDDIVNDKVKKNTRVGITVYDDDDSIYLIERHRKHKQGKNRLKVSKLEDGGVTDLTKGTDKLTQPLVSQILAQSEYVFGHATYSAQEAMPDLPALTDKNLKALIEEAAGIDLIQNAHEIASNELKEAKNERSAIESKAETLRSSLEIYTGNRDSVKESFSQWVADHKISLADTKGSLVAAATSYKLLKTGLTLLDDREIQVQSEIDEARLRVDDFQSQTIELATHRTAVSNIVHELSRSETRRDAAKRDAEKYLKEAKEVSMDPGDCSKCGSPLDAETHKAVANAEKQKLKKFAQDFATNYKGYVQEIKDHNEKLSEAQGALESFESSMTDVSQEIALIDALTSEKDDIRDSKLSISNAKREFADSKSKHEIEEAKENPHVSGLKTAEQHIVKIGADIATAKGELAIANTNETLAAEVMAVFGPAGVRAHILDTVTPFLNQRTSHYLGILSDGNITAFWDTISLLATGEAREKFAISVESKTGAKSYKGLSGGEKRKVKLSCAMALQDLVASRSSKSLQLFMADEIDDSVDQSGLERLMMLLDEKAKEKGTLLVISHNSLSDWIRQSVTVVKDGGLSSLKGSALT